MSKKLFIISGHSGAGKNFLMRMIEQACNISGVVSVTTRQMREGEVDGKNYFFLDTEEFENFVENGDMAEWIKYDTGDMYGVWKDEINNKLNDPDKDGTYIIAEYSGMKQLKELYPDAVTIFVYTDIATSVSNMAERGDSVESIKKRIPMYNKAISTKGEYDYVIHNIYGMSASVAGMLQVIVKNELRMSDKYKARSNVFSKLINYFESCASSDTSRTDENSVDLIADETSTSGISDGATHNVSVEKDDNARVVSEDQDDKERLFIFKIHNNENSVPTNDTEIREQMYRNVLGKYVVGMCNFFYSDGSYEIVVGDRDTGDDLYFDSEKDFELIREVKPEEGLVLGQVIEP